MRREAGPAHGLPGSLRRFHQRHDHPFGPGVQSLADGGGAVLGHPHHHRHVGGRRDRADRGLHVPALPEAVLEVEHDRVRLLPRGDLDQGHAAEREPDDAEAVAAVDPVAQGRAARVDIGYSTVP